MAERVNVRAIRQRLGLNRDDFGALVGAHPRTVRRWENGEGDPSPMAVKHLFKVREEADEVESGTRRKALPVTTHLEG